MKIELQPIRQSNFKHITGCNRDFIKAFEPSEPSESMFLGTITHQSMYIALGQEVKQEAFVFADKTITGRRILIDNNINHVKGVVKLWPDLRIKATKEYVATLSSEDYDPKKDTLMSEEMYNLYQGIDIVLNKDYDPIYKAMVQALTTNSLIKRVNKFIQCEKKLHGEYDVRGIKIPIHGTPDIMAVVNGRNAIIDIKTTADIHKINEYRIKDSNIDLQVAFYKMLAEQNGITIHDLYVLFVDREGRTVVYNFNQQPKIFEDMMRDRIAKYMAYIAYFFNCSEIEQYSGEKINMNNFAVNRKNAKSMFQVDRSFDYIA